MGGGGGGRAVFGFCNSILALAVLNPNISNRYQQSTRTGKDSNHVWFTNSNVHTTELEPFYRSMRLEWCSACQQFQAHNSWLARVYWELHSLELITQPLELMISTISASPQLDLQPRQMQMMRQSLRMKTSGKLRMMRDAISSEMLKSCLRPWQDCSTL